MLRIEKLKQEDIAEVIAISVAQFGANGWQNHLFCEELDKENHFAYVAKLDGKVVCFVFFMKTYGENGEDFNVLNVATKKGFENMGIGTEVFSFLIKFAKNLGAFSLWLEVRENNHNAIRFYANLGFRQDYIRKNYYANGDNAIVMTLLL